MAEGEAGPECSNRRPRMNRLGAIDPQAWAPEQYCEGGLDEAGEIQPRNCYRPHWEPTRENIDALFRDVDDMVEWMRSQNIEEPQLLLPNDDQTNELNALFEEVDAILELDRLAPWDQDPGAAQELLGDRAEQATAATAEPPPVFVHVEPRLGARPGASAGRDTEVADRLAFLTRGADSEGSGLGDDDRLTLRSVD